MQEILLLMTRLQIAEKLGVDRKTLYNKIKKAKLKLLSGLLTPKDQNLIYELFGQEIKVPNKNLRP